ncbi:hypothetical protein H5410_002842 [Solanum commersonii]|uniref:Uncharacterized protein n=1 Tax=Solanum commersonii TaxID=4109 RepID=A0A9J6B2Z3_SOLCO|nr:hypothetical protein H5410_002842 [Solanum commersonii]
MNKRGSLQTSCKKRDKDDHYLVNYSKLGFKQLDFVVAFSKKKDWFYVMSQPNRCWTDEHVGVILYYLRNKSKQLNHSEYDIPLLIGSIYPLDCLSTSQMRFMSL